MSWSGLHGLENHYNIVQKYFTIYAILECQDFSNHKGSGKCGKNGVGYRIRCENCQLDGKSTIYDGETGKNGYTRGLQHQDALRLRDEENALLKHCMVEHGSTKADFSMKVLGVFRSCLSSRGRGARGRRGGRARGRARGQ